MKFSIMIQAGDQMSPERPNPGTMLMVPRDLNIHSIDSSNNIIGTLVNYDDVEELPVPTGYNINNIDIGWCFTHKDTLNMKGFDLFLVTIFMI